MFFDQTGGGHQVGEVTCDRLPHLTYKRDHNKMRDYMDRRVTSPTCGPPPSCEQALRQRHASSPQCSLTDTAFDSCYLDL